MPLISSSRCLPADWMRCRSAIDALLVAVRGFLLQQLAVENDRVQRRAQLVAHAGEEVALRARRGFGLPLRHAQLDRRGRSAARRSPLGLVRLLEIPGVARELRSARLRSMPTRRRRRPRPSRPATDAEKSRAREDRHDADQLRVNEQRVAGKGRQTCLGRAHAGVISSGRPVGRSQARRPVRSRSADLELADRHPRLRTVGRRVRARRAASERASRSALVQRPDSGEAAVEMLRPCASAHCLQHRLRLGRRASARGRRAGRRARARAFSACCRVRTSCSSAAVRSAVCRISATLRTAGRRRGRRPRTPPRPRARASATGSRRARRTPTAARSSRAACDRARRRSSPEREPASHDRTQGTPASRRRGSAFRCGRR